jgi:hypothetical protein
VSAIAVEISAEEVIEKIKKLPLNELEAVKLFLEGYVVPSSTQPGEAVASDTEFKNASDEVFTKFDGLLRRLAK